MKLKHYALIAAVIPFAATGVAWAQSNNSYNSNQQAAPTLYNSGQTAQPLALQRMLSATTTPGVDAPSYTYKNQQQAQPYNFGSTTTTSNTYGSQQQGSYYDQNAAPPSQRFLEELARQQAASGQRRQDQGAYYAAQQGQQQGRPGYANNDLPSAAQPQQKPQRRVVYKERNNPLTEPQRLFNPDQ